MSSHPDPTTASFNRRDLLRQAGGGLGLLALSSLLQEQQSCGADSSAPNLLAARDGHFPAKAKAVIWLFMNGGPSQVDTWDYKPELARQDGKPIEGFDKNTGFFTGAVGPVMKSPFEFKQHGESGSWVSDLFPRISQHVDKMAFIHSLYSDSNNHSPALFKINTGMTRMGFPCVGSWVTYGLGSENNSLPSFVAMSDPLGRGLPKGHAQNWGSGFLPSILQGTWLRPKGVPIENLNRPADLTLQQQQNQLALLKRLTGHRPSTSPSLDLELEARIKSFELAYRMQQVAPETLDVERETRETQDLYGLHEKKCSHFARQCLMARRLVERGVRFIQIYSGGNENARSWDGHSNIVKNHGGFAAETDTPIAGLLTDLDQRGLLDSTLVIWGGEFGRLPIIQKGGSGRDHNPHAFTYWFAGGGVRQGTHYGKTDPIGFKAVENRTSVNDLHATILHLLGLHHEKLTFRLSGRDFRLTDVAGQVIREIIA
ncbi:MAG: DUF1501 domain-containing protein [Pirellulaceae bacterium]